MKHFKGVKTIEDLKKSYRSLAKRYHPDLNEDDTTKIMQEINNEYDWMFEHLKHTSTNKQDHAATNDNYKEIISELLKHENITIDIVGSWLWVSGDTFPIKDDLKKLGFRWSRSNKKWYLGDIDPKKKRRHAISWDEKVNKYGNERLQSHTRQKLAQ